jgi:hypothetical protein
LRERVVAPRAGRRGTADHVRDEANAAGLAEGVLLQVGELVGGGDAGMADQHVPIVSNPVIKRR